MKTKFQKFEAVTINRKEIKNAPYNPRKIKDTNFKKLKANIKKIGLIETLVVNKKTMNLISGHQRIKILDALEKKDDYTLTVAMVEMTEKEEMEQNIFMNNLSTQGEYNIESLTELIDNGLVEWENIGFDEWDKLYMEDYMRGEEEEQNKDRQEIIDEIENIKKIRKETKAKSRERDNYDDYIILVFKNADEKNKTIEQYGISDVMDDSYMDGVTFIQLILKHKVTYKR